LGDARDDAAALDLDLKPAVLLGDSEAGSAGELNLPSIGELEDGGTVGPRLDDVARAEHALERVGALAVALDGHRPGERRETQHFGGDHGVDGFWQDGQIATWRRVPVARAGDEPRSRDGPTSPGDE